MRRTSGSCWSAPSSSSYFKGGALDLCCTDGTSSQLRTRAPFHLEATVRVLQRRPANLVETWEHDRYLRVLKTSDDLVLIEVENRGTIEEPDVRYVLRHGNPSTLTRRELAQTLRKVLGPRCRPDPDATSGGGRSQLRSTALALRGLRPPRFADWFETFANVVPFQQQVSLDAGVAIVGRLVERFGKRLTGAWPRSGRGSIRQPSGRTSRNATNSREHRGVVLPGRTVKLAGTRPCRLVYSGEGRVWYTLQCHARVFAAGVPFGVRDGRWPRRGRVCSLRR